MLRGWVLGSAPTLGADLAPDVIRELTWGDGVVAGVDGVEDRERGEVGQRAVKQVGGEGAGTWDGAERGRGWGPRICLRSHRRRRRHLDAGSGEATSTRGHAASCIDRRGTGDRNRGVGDLKT